MTSKSLLSTLLSVICIFTLGCANHSPKVQQNGQVLQLVSGKKCDDGSIRPPGVAKCLRISDIVANKIPDKAPLGKCPKNWSKSSRKGFCLPTYFVQACGKKTFACDMKPGDTMRVKPGIPSCDQESQLVLVETLFFSTSGELFLNNRPGIACAPLDKGNPVIQ